MTWAAAQTSRNERAIRSSAFVGWLEVRVRRIGNRDGLKLWSVIVISLFIAWVAVVSNVPL